MPRQSSIIERRLLSIISKSSNLDIISRSDISEKHFNTYGDVFSFIMEFNKKYGSVPSIKLIKSKFKDFRLVRVNDSDAKHYASEIKASYVRRNSKKILSEAVDMLSDNENPSEALKYVMGEFSELNEEVLDHKFVIHFTDSETGSRIALLKNRRKLIKSGKTIGIPTGIDLIDSSKVGFVASNLILIAGPPEVGKSWKLMDQCAIAYAAGKKILYINPEMSRFELECRFDTVVGRRYGFSFPNADLVEGKFKFISKYREWATLVQKENRWVTLDTEDSTVLSLSNIERTIKDFKPDVVAIDQLPLIMEGGFATDWSQYVKIGYDLKSIAKKYNVIVLAVVPSQGDTFESDEPADLSQLALAKYVAYAADWVISISPDSTDEMYRFVKVPKRRGGKKIMDKLRLKFDVNNGIIEQESSEAKDDDAAKS